MNIQFSRRSGYRVGYFFLTALITVTVGCASQPVNVQTAKLLDQNPNRLFAVDCLLPSIVKRLGQSMNYLEPRKPIKTTASDCEIRGGEYVAYDRANYATALKVWMPRAQEGDPEAQTYIGEIYEKGLGIEADYALAAAWYRKAASKNYSRAQINLGFLYESGLGVNRDLTEAMNWYRKASGLTDGDLEYVSSLESTRRIAAKKESAALKVEVSELRTAVAGYQAELLKQEQELSFERSEMDKLRSQLKLSRERLAQQKRSQSTEKTTDSAELQALQKGLITARAEQARLTDKLVLEQTTTARMQEKLIARERALALREKELQASRSQAAQLAASLESRKAETGDSSQISLLAQQLDASKKKISIQQKALEVMKQEQTVQRQALRDQLNSALTAQQTAEQALTQSRSEQARLQSKLVNLQNVQSMPAADTKQLVVLQNKERELQDKLAQARAEQTRLQGKLAAALADISSASSLEALDLQIKQERQAQKQLANQLQASRQEQQRLQERLASANLRQNSSAQKITSLEAELKTRQKRVQQQEQVVAGLKKQLAEADKMGAGTEPAAARVIETVASGPSIEIIEPPLVATRSVPSILLRDEVPEIEIVGRVTANKGLLTFKVNDRKHQWSDDGVVTWRQPVNKPNTPVKVVAVDKSGNREALDFLLVPQNMMRDSSSNSKKSTTSPAYRRVDFGNYHALVIGNNTYSNFTNLKTAENDARVIAGLLKNKYGFNTRLVLNADRYQMLSVLNEYREKLTENDNLLIYYAGHGELDQVNLRGYWLPVDAEPNSNTNWISNVAITDLLNVMSAKQVLVVADSCYSGAMTRSSIARLSGGMSKDARARWLATMSKVRARAVLTSGGVAPVLDAGGGAHSLFANAFINVLRQNNEILEGYKLYREVQKQMKPVSAKLNVEQDPQYAPIKFAGHEAGDFFFLPNRREASLVKRQLIAQK